MEITKINIFIYLYVHKIYLHRILDAYPSEETFRRHCLQEFQHLVR